MKRVFFVLFVLRCMPEWACSQRLSWSKNYQDYFDQYGDVAVEQMRKYGVPASITLAQGVLESGAGRSELARKANNHFGIKCNNGWRGATSYHDDDERGECFRAYANVYQSYVDHSLFLRNGPRYSRLFDLKQTDYRGWAKGLKTCGYATNPIYDTKLIDIIELYRLYDYDTGKGGRGASWQVRNGVSRTVHPFNKNYYVVARQGDTFQSLASEFGVSSRRLANYNERDKNDVLEEGEYVWLQKKRSKAPKDYKGYIYKVDAGESMYSIAQRFGIRAKNLYKLNGLKPDYVLKVGDNLKVR